MTKTPSPWNIKEVLSFQISQPWGAGEEVAEDGRRHSGATQSLFEIYRLVIYQW